MKTKTTLATITLILTSCTSTELTHEQKNYIEDFSPFATRKIIELIIVEDDK